MTLLEVEGVTKYYKRNKKLAVGVEDICFEIQEGECVGLVGESGCGKSTLAGIISRLIKEDSGSIYFEGDRINSGLKLSPVGKSLQMIFQNPKDSFDPRDTVLKGVMQGAESYKLWSKQDLVVKSLEMLEYVGLKQSHASLKVAELSGGECQRVAIARALMCEPKLLISDETTSFLDVLVQAQIVDLLIKLINDKNMAVLFITHDIPLAAVLCDRIVVMHRGKIIEMGISDNIINNPKQEQTKLLIESSYLMI